MLGRKYPATRLLKLTNLKALSTWKAPAPKLLLLKPSHPNTLVPDNTVCLATLLAWGVVERGVVVTSASHDRLALALLAISPPVFSPHLEGSVVIHCCSCPADWVVGSCQARRAVGTAPASPSRQSEVSTNYLFTPKHQVVAWVAFASLLDSAGPTG